VNTRYIPELKWYLFVEQAEDPSLEGLRKTLYGNLAVCLLITAVVLLATSYTMNYYQARVDKMATTDKLTGALNRQAFDIVFQQALKDHQRTKAPMSAILFDLDHFKEINDTYGHLAGDRVLAAVTNGVQEVLRKADVICRWGGEEFLVLLRDCPGGQAFILAEKIREVVIVTKVEEGGTHIPIAVSLGVAERKPEEPLDRLIYRADEALFTAKREGRNRSVMAR
jgi:diguanylate cyclase (GGDEF)-like protein